MFLSKQQKLKFLAHRPKTTIPSFLPLSLVLPFFETIICISKPTFSHFEIYSHFYYSHLLTFPFNTLLSTSLWPILHKKESERPHKYSFSHFESTIFSFFFHHLFFSPITISLVFEFSLFGGVYLVTRHLDNVFQNYFIDFWWDLFTYLLS